MKGVFDVNKSLTVLYDEWTGCTDCDLGVARDLLESQQVFGAGKERGILFLGEAPNGKDVRAGAIVGGQPGKFLMRVMSVFRMHKFYVTNMLACRGCTPMLDESGLPIIGKSYGRTPGKPRYKDQPATRPQTKACSERVYEEIYKADPVVIVTFGQAAAAFLRGDSFNLIREHGIPEIISIPGAGHVATLSPKRKEWFRKVHGQLVSPVERSQVEYLMVPTYDPRDVHQKINDESKGNPYEKFTNAMRRAKQIFDAYNEELYDLPPDRLGTEDDLHMLMKETQAEKLEEPDDA